MQANVSLILNVLLLIGVIVAIARLIKAKRQPVPPFTEPSLGAMENKPVDDIIAVRKITPNLAEKVVIKPAEVKMPAPQPQSPKPDLIRVKQEQPRLTNNDVGTSVMMFLLAKKNRQLAGYELLQTVLAAGLRFGEGHIFHRHQHLNGQGPVICSLAAATKSGVFDLQNIGAFSVQGLCLFMQASGNASIDAERFNIMLDTARQLSDGLDAHLLTEKRQPLNDENINDYYQALNIKQPVQEEEFETA